MNIDYLREFTVLASKLNFRTAATKLCISQSTLSKHILSLEQTYGVQLLRRGRHEVELTDAGSTLLDYAFRIIRLYEESLDVCRIFSSVDNRVVRVSGLFDNPHEKDLMEKLFTATNQDVSNITLRLIGVNSMSTQYLSSLLDDDKIDAFLTYDLPSPYQRDWREDQLVTEIARIPLIAVVNRNDSLSTKKTLDLNDLVGKQFIHLVGPLFTPTWSLIEQVIESAEIPYHVKPVVASSAYDYANIDVSQSILLVPYRPMLPQVFNNPEHSYIPIADERFSLNLIEVHLARSHNEALKRFVEIYREVHAKFEGLA